MNYDAEEAAAIAALPKEYVEAFRPVAFERVKYPTRAELKLYVDAMHQGTERIWGNIGYVCDYELQRVRDIARGVADLTEQKFSQRITPRDALLQAVIPWRAVRALCAPHSSIREIGPGSGYLGLLLSGDGYKYSAFEVTQGFYLWQRELNEWFGRPAQAPWWETDFITEADWYIANHVLNEMHPRALEILATECRAPIIAENYGSVCIRRTDVTQTVLKINGWELARLNEHVDIWFPPDRRPKGWADMAEALSG